MVMNSKQPGRTEKTPSACAERQAIASELVKSLDEYIRLTRQQIDLLKTDDYQSAQDLAAELEAKNGQQERAFDTLLQHIKEHNCLA
jgi:hypothetical protein